MNINVSQLLTPEEPLLDNFDRSKSFVAPTHSVPSPPASPAAFHDYPHRSSNASFPQPHDSLLYPDHNQVVSTDHEQPLFGTAPSFQWTSPERQHSPATHIHPSSPPSARRDSRFPLPLEHKSIASPRPSHENARAEVEPVGPVALNNYWGDDYYRLMVEQMEKHRIQRLAHRQLPPVEASCAQTRDQYTQKQVYLLGRNNRIEKPKPSAKLTPRQVKATVKAITPPPKVESSTKRRRRRKASTPALPPTLSAATWTGHQPQHASAPKPRTRAAPTKEIKVDYTLWPTIKDVSPPVDTLDSEQMTKKLTATWTNPNPLNLANDPDREHLHAQELELASTLRLRCNQYLTLKRFIFLAKVKALVGKREFNKTLAQESCPVDVNKTSRLWAAFNSVGWFNEHWFKAHLEQSPST